MPWGWICGIVGGITFIVLFIRPGFLRKKKRGQSSTDAPKRFDDALIRLNDLLNDNTPTGKQTLNWSNYQQFLNRLKEEGK